MKAGRPKQRKIVGRSLRIVPGVRRSAGRLSSTTKRETTTMITLNTAITQKMPRHPMIGERKTPSSGAIAGARPWIAISAEKAEAAALPCATSGMTERATTTVVPPAMPWSSRKAISKPIDGVSIHPAEKRKNSNEPITRGWRRPTPSETGPANS